MKSDRQGTTGGSNRLKRVARRLTLLLLATSMYAQPNAGSITLRNLPAAAQPGEAVFDAQQNVYIAGGGGCAGVNCTPISVVKADPNGNQIFSFVDNSHKGAPFSAVAVDAAGETYIIGRQFTGGSFAAKLSADGSKYVYFLQLASALLAPTSLQLDGQGNSYFAGMTADYHPFVAALAADGSKFLYMVTLPGSSATSATPDYVSALALDSAGNAIVAGQTYSSDFPVTAGALQTTPAGSPTGFVTKIDRSGHIVASTFLGGAGAAGPVSIAIDSQQNLYVAGVTVPPFPTTAGTYEPTATIPLWSGGGVGFLAKLKSDMSAIVWSTYVPSNGAQLTFDFFPRMPIAIAASGDVYFAASTFAGFTPTASAPHPCYAAGGDAVVLHLTAQGTLADSTYVGIEGASAFGFTLPDDGSVLLAVANTTGASPQLAQVVFGSAGWIAPACLSPDVLNAASFLSGISPGEFVTLTGFGIGPDAGVAYTPGPQGQVPTSLAGVTVSFNGIPAPLLYVQSRQVNAQVPFEVSTSTTSETRVSVTLTYQNQTFGPYTFTSNWLGAPGIFRLQPGLSTLAAALNQDGTVNSPSNPAASDSFISLFGTGYGPLVPPCSTGALNPSAAVPLYYTGSPVGNPLTNQQFSISYEGSAPTLLCGIDQFNFQIPANAPSGPFVLTPYINPGYEDIIYVK